MRLLTRTDGKWEPSPSTDLLSWLIAHNNTEAVAISEEGEKVFYCGTDEVMEGYQAKGHTAYRFATLAATLPIPDPTTHPNYCVEGREVEGWAGYVMCSAKGECGGKRKYCQNEREWP